jgi:DNA-binding transcriptional MerR regulator
MSGLTPLVIRAWERRYGILEPRRTAAGYRTYSQSDIELLKRLRELTDEGLSISQAIELIPRIRRELKPGKPLKPPLETQLQRWQDQVLGAAKRLDQPAVERALDEAFRSMAPVKFFEELVAPLMREVGARWHAQSLSVKEEHLISAVVREKLVALFMRAPRRSKQHVLCACPSEDAHEFGLLGAGLRFRHASWKVTLLGAKTPVDQLVSALELLEPDVVAISLVESTGARAYLDELAAALPASTSVVLGGQAATALADHAKRHGFRVVENEAGWKRLLGRTK